MTAAAAAAPGVMQPEAPEQGGRIVPWRSAQTEKDFSSFLGMLLFLASWVMLFAGLFLVYGLLRLRAPVWPPPGAVRVPIGPALANTLVLLFSSVTAQVALAAARADRRAAVARWLGATLALGTAFLAGQAAIWWSLDRAGLSVRSLYGGVFYALSGFHALHVAVGVAVIAWLWHGARRERYGAPRHAPVRLGAMFWHFVDAVWLFLFLTVVLI